MKFSDETLDKARSALAKHSVEPDKEFANIWWVTSINSKAVYRVQADYDPDHRSLSWITCTCPHGMMSGAGTTRCYHAGAVLILLQEAMEHG